MWGQPSPRMSFAKLVNVKLSAGRWFNFPFLVIISAIKTSDYFGFWIYIYNMTQSMGFGNKGAPRWGCAEHYESQQQLLRQGMVGCLRRPSCTSAMGDTGISVPSALPPEALLSMTPTLLLHIANKNPTRNPIIIGECQEVILFFLPWCRGQSTCTQYLPLWGLQSSCFPTLHLPLPPFQSEKQI